MTPLRAISLPLYVQMRRLMERKIDGYRTVVRDWLGRIVVQIAEGAREVGRENTRSSPGAGAVEGGFHKDPIELQFGHSKLLPPEFGYEGRNESFAQALIGVAQSSGRAVDGPFGDSAEIKG